MSKIVSIELKSENQLHKLEEFLKKERMIYSWIENHNQDQESNRRNKLIEKLKNKKFEGKIIFHEDATSPTYEDWGF